MGTVKPGHPPTDRLLPVPGRGGRRLGAVEAMLANASCEVVRAGSWLPVPRDWRLRGHRPATHVVLLGTGGSAEYVIGDAIHRMGAGRLLWCPASVWREATHDPGNPLHLYAVHFRARLYGVIDLPSAYRLPTALSPSPERHARMVAAAQRVVESLRGEAPAQAMAADGACMELLALVCREAAEDPRSAAGDAADLSRLAPVFRLVEERYGEPLSLRDLAGALGLGPAYFSTIFKRDVGMAPTRYLRSYRLSRVRELLVTTDLPVDSVARQTGFSDGTYLSRVFRAEEGVPPGEYRRAQRSPMMS